jgi:hypothetical protein
VIPVVVRVPDPGEPHPELLDGRRHRRRLAGIHRHRRAQLLVDEEIDVLSFSARTGWTARRVMVAYTMSSS